MNFNFDVYYKDLEKMEGVRFTLRELDIIACILSGRTSKKAIASFLSIQPKTVNTHTHNITQKLGCGSWEGIRDFIEKSDKGDLLRQLYKDLLMQEEFKKSLKEIANSIKKISPSFSIFFDKEETQLLPIVLRALEDLKSLGINVIIEKKEVKEGSLCTPRADDIDFVLFFVSTNRDTFLQNKKSIPIKYILSVIEEVKTEEVYQKNNSPECVKINAQGNYYLFFFSILENVFLDKTLNEKILRLKIRYQEIQRSFKNDIHAGSIELSKYSNTSRYLIERIQNIKKWHVLIGFLIVSILYITSYILRTDNTMESKSNTASKEMKPIRSSLVIPSDNALLKRSNFMNEIQEKLDKQEGIQTVSLVGVVGMGGVGKTTLARLFGREQSTLIIYEINAETRNSILISFKELGKSLAQNGTKENKERFDIIENIDDPQEQEKQILSFVQQRLKESGQWILIYDNVESLSDIKEYFPQEPNIWGHGKVIITTRNNNIKNSTHINPNNIIQIDELTQDEALTLFTKILYECEPSKLDVEKQKEISYFLKSIPPFPLDISVAASYIKITKSSFEEYINNLKNSNSEFESLQKDLLKENGDYTKTRYAIITQSLNRLIKENSIFADFLLMMSLLDSQDIPRELFDKYKNKTVVDNFIYNLKKYSLITVKELNSDQPSISLSIHRSTQEISLAYLIKLLSEEQKNSILQNITQTLGEYITEVVDHEYLSKLKLIANHSEVFLNHEFLLNDAIKSSINAQLGIAYLHLGYYEKAKNLLEQVLPTLNKYHQHNQTQIVWAIVCLGKTYIELGENEKAANLLEELFIKYKGFFSEKQYRTARALSDVGNIYNDLGKYEKARDLLESSVTLYKEKFSEAHIGIAMALAWLGNAYRNLGDYKKAKDTFEQSLEIYKKNSLQDHVHVSWILMYLGDIYKNLGDYRKATLLLEQGLKIYKKYFLEDHINIGWFLIYMGDAYEKANDLEKAKEVLEQSLEIHRKLFKDDSIRTAPVLNKLGNVYGKLGNFNEAKKLLEKSLDTHNRNFGKNHIKTARVLRDLGQIYFLEGNIQEAENLIKESLRILQLSNYPNVYGCLEDLGDLYLAKSVLEVNNPQQSSTLRTKAYEYFKEAHAIAKNQLPEGSPKIKMIEQKCNKP